MATRETREQIDSSNNLDLQAEITRVAFHKLAPTIFVGAVGMCGATALLAYNFHDAWLWGLTSVMILIGALRTAVPVAFARRKNRELTATSARRWIYVYAGLSALNCCNLAASTLYNFSHHNQTAQFICTMGVFLLCAAMGSNFGLKPWMAQGCGLIVLASLAYPIAQSSDPVLAWDGCGMIALFLLMFCKLVSSKYEMVVEQLRMKSTMSYLAEHDALTGLANRRQFEASLAETCQKPGTFAVLFLDLDGFKKVNDTHGHATGDVLLQQVASRLKETVHQSDLVSRLGGDEFAILHRPLATVQSTEALARHILGCVSAPYSIEGHAIRIGTSIGIQLSTPGRNDPDRLLSEADDALYKVKQTGKGEFRFVESTGAVVIAGPRAPSPDSGRRTSKEGAGAGIGRGKLLIGVGE